MFGNLKVKKLETKANSLKFEYRMNSNLNRILIEAAFIEVIGQNLSYSPMDDFLRHILVYFMAYA